LLTQPSRYPPKILTEFFKVVKNREAQNLLLPNDYNKVFAVLTFCYFGVKTKVADNQTEFFIRGNNLKLHFISEFCKIRVFLPIRLKLS